MAEYAFVVAAIAIAVIGSYELMGGHLSFLVNHLSSQVASAS
jgi:Flp pilus assembly pilin Flp